MDFEAMQLLNLSPIPELSELELSTMLEQLSGLSDINGDLTDRNVEDIIKEAEDLLDKSRSSEINISKSKKSSETKEDKLPVDNADVVKDTEEPDTEKTDLNGSRVREKSPVKTDHPTTHSSSNEVDSTKRSSSSPPAVTSPKVCSPGTSCNHIKSAIDSLKEYSTLVEKKLTQPPIVKQNKTTKQDEKGLQLKNNDQLNEKLMNLKPSSKGKVVKPPEAAKKSTSENLDKSIRLLNCFERLYQDRPLRLANCKKPKAVDKIQKVSRKLSKEFKNVKKNVGPKSVKRDVLEEVVGNSVSANDSLLPHSIFIDNDPTRTCENKEDEYFLCNDTLVQNKKNSAEEEEEVALCQLRHSPISHYQCDGLKPSSTIDEKLILKVLEEMEEIKDQVRKAGVFSDTLNQGVRKGSPENEGMPRLESNTTGSGFEPMKNTDIKRLEEQVSNLKDKYDHQMEKLEAENSRLREALNSKLYTPQFVYPDMAEGFPIEKKTFKTSIFNFSPTSKESVDCKTPKNTPSQSPEYTRVVAKEAFSQTQKDVKTTSSQCSIEIEPSGTRENAEGETKETENKENVVVRKKSGKWKPFSDINVHHLMKQKKVFDHEAQLLATVRGLQAEMAGKEKENRKLRSEVDSLRRQVNKWTNLKVDTCRKCHIGTQTIGLGPAVQKPYDPANYEAPEELQKENEELRFKLKTLEEDLELLKEKRINDLQALHQVHEEEMAKLVSKLETQSALTKHLHSLLVNR